MSNIDAFTAEEVEVLAKFKRTVMEYVPPLSVHTYKESCETLNAIDAASEASFAISRTGSRESSLHNSDSIKMLNPVESHSPKKLSAADLESLPPLPPDEEVITVKRKNSKFLDVRGTMIDTFGSMQDIGGAVNPDIVKNLTEMESSRASEENVVMAKRRSSSEKKSIESMLQVANIETDMSRSDLHAAVDNFKDFAIPKGPVTLHTAALVVDVYKHGGRLSTHTVQRILRNGYRSLKALNNTVYVTIKPEERLTIVGDIHGQLADLLHILDDSGLPSSTNKYIFNGDFVDRGPMGVEVMLLLLCFHAAAPNSVFLNRGNHEDYAICCAYGFQKECFNKYDEVTFGMFVEVFQFLPLFCIVNDSVMVLHGGLFHTAETLLADLNEINRSDFTLRDLPDGGEQLDPFDKVGAKGKHGMAVDLVVNASI